MSNMKQNNSVLTPIQCWKRRRTRKPFLWAGKWQWNRYMKDGNETKSDGWIAQSERIASHPHRQRLSPFDQAGNGEEDCLHFFS